MLFAEIALSAAVNRSIKTDDLVQSEPIPLYSSVLDRPPSSVAALRQVVSYDLASTSGSDDPHSDFRWSSSEASWVVDAAAALPEAQSASSATKDCEHQGPIPALSSSSHDGLGASAVLVAQHLARQPSASAGAVRRDTSVLADAYNAVELLNEPQAGRAVSVLNSLDAEFIARPKLRPRLHVFIDSTSALAIEWHTASHARVAFSIDADGEASWFLVDSNGHLAFGLFDELTLDRGERFTSLGSLVDAVV
ncbi:hypothetical protein L6R52_35500 [Myxococcota bacterium]|nr:hypothetical protein [Myxococcota bacterium]